MKKKAAKERVLATRSRATEKPVKSLVSIASERVVLDTPAVDENSDGTSSESGNRGRVQIKSSTLKVFRREEMVQKAKEDGLLGLSFLESRAIGTASAVSYRRHLEAWLRWATLKKLSLQTAEQIDESLVQFFDHCYRRGGAPHLGEKTLSAVMHFYPEFGRYGSRKIPRAGRSLQGWRKVVPGRSRRPYPFNFWAAVCVNMIQRRLTSMAAMTLMMVDTYMRPGEAMGLLREDLLPPVSGISARWTLVIRPEERPERTKTGEADDCAMWDSPRLQWFSAVLAVLCEGGRDKPVFEFTYPSYAAEFKKTCLSLGVEGVVPYQARHSGASLDRLHQRRTLQEVMKRGRWKVQKSLVRYEKHGRIQATALDFTASQRAHFDRAEAVLADAFLKGQAKLPLTWA